MDYIDISPPISQGSPVFPGDQAYERTLNLAFAVGDHLELSAIKTTLHIGAHADAPAHYHKEGLSIDKRDLSYYFGACQVINVCHVGNRRIKIEDIDIESVQTSRLLFKSKSFVHDQPFQTEFTSLSPELIQKLAQMGVKLLGIDTPSVDPANSQDLPAHAALYLNNLAVLEGIDLDRVAPGTYQLIALPLRLVDADASPVRAILLPSGSPQINLISGR